MTPVSQPSQRPDRSCTSCPRERSLVQVRVDEVVISGVNGYFGVLLGHAPLLA